MRQLVHYAHYAAPPRVDYVILVNADRSEQGVGLVGAATASILESSRAVVERGGELWRPVEQRAFVISVETGAVLGPGEQVNLAWSEPHATREGAEAFGAALRDAMRVSVASAARGHGQIALLHRTLRALEPASDGTLRQVVLLTTTDDAEAAPERDLAFEERARDARRERRDVYEQLVVVVPATRSDAGCVASTPRVEAWARANPSVLFTPACAGVPAGVTWDGESGTRCFDQAVMVETCRVRAFVPENESCDRDRGWRDAVDARSTDADLQRKRVCDVAPLDGEEALCMRARSHDWRASGWCLPPRDRFCPGPLPRLVGGAAPPWATIEITCDVR